MAQHHPVALALLLTAISAAAGAAAPLDDADGPAAPLTSSASLARIRTQLAHPARLQMALPKEAPTFRLEVRAHRYWTDKPFVAEFKVPPMSPLMAPRAPGEPGIGAAGGGVGGDPYAAIAAVRRFFRQRAAEEEVRKTVAELCAVTACPPRD